jgi:hypothetical protein
LTCALLTGVAVAPVHAQDYDSVTAVSVVDTADEGPHIYWREESIAVVMYLCEGEIQVQQLIARGELRFRGLCSDSATEHVVPAREPRIEPSEFSDVPRILAVSDIHGEYEALVELLTNARVIDEQLHWSWDKGHLVVVGDVFDRGDRVTECLWLIHRLEREAREAGGRVHYLLGNHEMMVLRGDNRYVNVRYLDGLPNETVIVHRDLYGPDMEFGRWLRSKHVAVKLNDIVYGMGLDDLNEVIRRIIDARSYELMFSLQLWFANGDTGPLWYRGYHGIRPEYAQATSEQVDAILDFYDAEAVVVGHTEVDYVESLYEGRVFGVDVPVDDLGSLQGLLWEDGTWFRVVGTGELEPIP